MKARNFSVLILIAVFAGLLFTGCKKQIQTEISLAFQTVTTPFNLSAEKVTTGTLAFTSGTIKLQEVKFKAESDNDSLETKFNASGLVTIDFATGQTTPDLGYIEIPAGTYEKVKVKLKLLDGDADNPSIILNGTYTDPNGDTIPVRFEYSDGGEFEVKQENVTFADNQSFMALVTIDPSIWFQSVTDSMMLNATRDTNGVIVISKNQNQNIYDAVNDNFVLANKMQCSQHDNDHDHDMDNDHDSDHDGDNS